MNDSTSKAFWKLGKVEQLISEKDGKVRVASVKVSSSNGKSQLLKRMIQHLIPIEVQAESNVPVPHLQQHSFKSRNWQLTAIQSARYQSGIKRFKENC